MGKYCCVFGHRKIEHTEELENKVYNIAEELITAEGVDTFIFGSHSDFNWLCYKVITKLKSKYPKIKRIYARIRYPEMDDDYKQHYYKGYEDTYFPERAVNAGSKIYVERNYDMIDKSDFCITYYKEDYLPPIIKKSIYLPSRQPKSGTRLAYDYAKKKNKIIINICV